MANVEIHEEVTKGNGDWSICFQWVTYNYGGEQEPQQGYRFIWRRPDGTLQPARGQARIPNSATLFDLIQAACKEGWFAQVEQNQS